jgi:hypothetical protein
MSGPAWPSAAAFDAARAWAAAHLAPHRIVAAVMSHKAGPAGAAL